MRLYDKTEKTTFELATYADNDDGRDFQYRLVTYRLPLRFGQPEFNAGKIRHDTFDEDCYYVDTDALNFFKISEWDRFNDWQFDSVNEALKALVKHSGRFYAD